MLVTLDVLAGQVADWTIDLALEAFRETGAVTDLAERAASTFDNLVGSSRRNVDAILRRHGIASNSHPLWADFYCRPLIPAVLESARRQIVDSCRRFQHSETFSRILGVPVECWSPPKKSIPFFRWPKGPAVYASYDFYFEVAPDVYVIDWKAGRLTKETSDEALAQLSVYGLFAVYGLKADPARVHCQTAWLRAGAQWMPQSPDPDRLRAMRRRIAKEHEAERAKLVESVERGKPVLKADRASFEPKTSPYACGRCNFLEICEAGRKTVGWQARIENHAS